MTRKSEGLECIERIKGSYEDLSEKFEEKFDKRAESIRSAYFIGPFDESRENPSGYWIGIGKHDLINDLVIILVGKEDQYFMCHPTKQCNQAGNPFRASTVTPNLQICEIALEMIFERTNNEFKDPSEIYRNYKNLMDRVMDIDAATPQGAFDICFNTIDMHPTTDPFKLIADEPAEELVEEPVRSNQKGPQSSPDLRERQKSAAGTPHSTSNPLQTLKRNDSKALER